MFFDSFAIFCPQWRTFLWQFLISKSSHGRVLFQVFLGSVLIWTLWDLIINVVQPNISVLIVLLHFVHGEKPFCGSSWFVFSQTCQRAPVEGFSFRGSVLIWTPLDLKRQCTKCVFWYFYYFLSTVKNLSVAVLASKNSHGRVFFEIKIFRGSYWFEHRETLW